MLVEYHIQGRDLHAVPEIVRRAEEVGYDVVTTSETSHDPFLPLVLAAEHSRRPLLATSVAIAFPRSPMVVAYTAWDLQKFSGGRLVLGLGTQVKGHNERRFSVLWTAPGPRLREYVLALRAIWTCWQNGTPLNFRGQHYTFTLMTPFFNPGPIEYPNIPIYIAAVNAFMARLAGEVCDGIRLHSFLSPKYLREVIIPAVRAGAARAGRALESFGLAGAGFVITGRTEADLAPQREAVRRQLAFYASTRTYRPVMEIHGWGETVDRLHRLSLQGKWEEMAGLITDEMLETYATIGTYDEIADRLRERYGGLVTSVAMNLPLETPADREAAKEVIAMVKRIEAFKAAA
jgi:probable F420-dependent oxidoreductase